MSQEVPISKLQNHLPHRPPMLWIDAITEVGQSYKGITGICRVKVTPEALFVSNHKELRGTSAIEFTAQGFGYVKAAYQVLHDFNDPPKKVFLTGVRSCTADFSGIDISKTPELEVHISVVRELLPVTFVRGEIRLPGEKTNLAEAVIQVYVD